MIKEFIATIKKFIANLFANKKKLKFIVAIVLSCIIMLVIILYLLSSCKKEESSAVKSVKPTSTTATINYKEIKLDQEIEQKTKRMALRQVGVGVPQLIFASAKKAIIRDSWGIIVYDLELKSIIRAIGPDDIKAFHIGYIEGDDAVEVFADKTGSQILIKLANPSAKAPAYLYDIDKNELLPTDKNKSLELPTNLVDNLDPSINISKEIFLGRIAKITDTRWLGLTFAGLKSAGNFTDMRMLNIVEVENNTPLLAQVFNKYNNLAAWPTPSDIIKDHLPHPFSAEVTGEVLTVKEHSKDDIQKELEKEMKKHNWKEASKEKDRIIYMKNINKHDVKISLSITEKKEDNTASIAVNLEN